MSVVVRRDGDMKLAALSPESAALLALTRVERFFEIFRTVEDGVHSFDTFVTENEKFRRAVELIWRFTERSRCDHGLSRPERK